MSHLASKKANPWIERLIALGLASCYVIWLLRTSSDLGYTRDEGFYFVAADSYKNWIELLLTHPAQALERGNIDRYWSNNHEHPAFFKTLFALSHGWLGEKWHWFRDVGTAYRFPGMLSGGLVVALIYLWGQRTHGRMAGFVAALFFVGMPRMFFHAHLDCFDMPIAAMWLLCAYLYIRAVESPRLIWSIAAGISYGLALNTKHNSWILFFCLLGHVAISNWGHWRRYLRIGVLPVPRAFLAMILIGPLVFLATWPWLWFDTVNRLSEYAGFHLQHVHYNMEFFGENYIVPPMPRAYAWVMSLITVPTIIWICCAVGFLSSAPKLLSFPASRRYLPVILSRSAFRHLSLWTLSILASYAPWWSPTTPIFGGTKHWITAYPFVCLFAGVGAVYARDKIAELLRSQSRQFLVLRADIIASLFVASSVLIGPLTMTAQSHPWGLSDYVPLAGGARGAATLGMNRTFWGYTTGAIVNQLNALGGENENVFVHDTLMPSFDMLLKDKRLKAGYRPSWYIHGSNIALYHHELHMRRVEFQIWLDYGTVKPAVVASHQGVPVVWAYRRPELSSKKTTSAKDAPSPRKPRKSGIKPMKEMLKSDSDD